MHSPDAVWRPCLSFTVLQNYQCVQNSEQNGIAPVWFGNAKFSGRESARPTTSRFMRGTGMLILLFC
jgi:hypothetical protein